MNDDTFLKTFEDLLLDQKDSAGGKTLADRYLKVYGAHRSKSTSIDNTWESFYTFTGDLLYIDDVAFVSHRYSTAGLYVTKIDDSKFPLYQAVKNLRLSYVTYFLEQGANVNATYKTSHGKANNMLHILGDTPWDEKKQAIMDKLKEYGIDTGHKNKYGLNPIIYAINNGHTSQSMINALKTLGCVIPTCPDPTVIGAFDKDLPYLKQIDSSSCHDDDSKAKNFIDQTKQSWGSKCDISCQDEYSMIYLPGNIPGQETNTQIICNRYGEWVPVDKNNDTNTLEFKDFECSSKSCGAPGDSNKANYAGNESVTCTNTAYSVGTTCTMSCSVGHYVVAYDYDNNQNDVQLVSSMDQPFAECLLNPTTSDAEWDFNYRCEKVQCTNVAHIQGILLLNKKLKYQVECILMSILV